VVRILIRLRRHEVIKVITPHKQKATRTWLFFIFNIPIPDIAGIAAGAQSCRDFGAVALHDGGGAVGLLGCRVGVGLDVAAGVGDQLGEVDGGFAFGCSLLLRVDIGGGSARRYGVGHVVTPIKTNGQKANGRILCSVPA